MKTSESLKLTKISKLISVIVVAFAIVALSAQAIVAYFMSRATVSNAFTLQSFHNVTYTYYEVDRHGNAVQLARTETERAYATQEITLGEDSSHLITSARYTPDMHYQIEGVTKHNGDTYTMPKRNVTIEEYYTLVTHNVTYNFDSANGGQVSPTDSRKTITEEFNIDENIDLTKTGYLQGYDFDGWVLDGTSEILSTLTMENSNITLNAVYTDRTAPNNTAPTGDPTISTITVTPRQEDNGSGIDESTIEYQIGKDTNGNGVIDDNEWSPWQSSDTFTGLDTDTTYYVRTRASDNDGNGPTVSESTPVTTLQIQNGTLVQHKTNAQGEIIPLSTDSTDRKHAVNTDVFLDITPAPSGTTTLTIKKSDVVQVTISDDQTLPTTSGLYELILKTVDGPNEASNTYYIYVDKDNPTVNPETQTTSSTITVDANEYDEHSGVKTVTYVLKDGNTVVATITKDENDIDKTATFTGLTQNKDYTLEVTATDYAGNSSTTSTSIVHTNTLTNGSLSFTEEDSGTQVNPIPNPTAEDLADETKTVWVNEDLLTTLTNGSEGTTTYTIEKVSGTPAEETQTETGSTTVPTTDGTYKFTVTTTDGTNTTEPTVYYINVDKTIPTVAVGTNGGNYVMEVEETQVELSTTVTGTDNANGSGVASVKYAWSTSNSTAPAAADWTTVSGATTTATNTVQTGGNYYLWTKATDKAGNESITIEKTNPFTVGYRVEYDMNGGTGTIESQVKTHGESLTLSSTVPTKTGYTFAGWSTNSAATPSQVEYTSGDIYTANAPAKLYAIWEVNAYTVTYNYNGGQVSSTNTDTTSTETVNYNDPIDLTKTAYRDGYTLIGWNTDSNATDGLASLIMGTSNVTVYAIYQRLDVTPEIVTIDLSSGTTTQALTVTGENYGTITYSSSNNTVATVNENGVITALANGVATITVTSTNGTHVITKTVQVTVVTTPTGISLNKEEVIVGVEPGYNTAEITATITPATANVDTAITWTSNNTSIATVTPSGTTATITGVADGETIVTAQTANGVTEQVTVTVDGTAPTVTVTRDNENYAKSHTGTVTVTDSLAGLPATQTIQYAWSQSNTSAPAANSPDWQNLTITATQGDLSASGNVTESGLTGTYYLWVKEGAIDRLANETTAAVHSPAMNFDNTKPEIDLNGNASTNKASASTTITIPLKITEIHSGIAENDFTENDITVQVDGNTVIPTTKTLTYNSETNGVYSYTLTLEGVTGTGDLTLLIPANAVIDNATNGNNAVELDTNVQMDATTFNCTITASETSPTNASQITYAFTFNKDTNTFSQEDITVTNGTITSFTKVSDSVYTAVISNEGTCIQTVGVEEDSCTDLYGNNVEDVTPVQISIDRTAPTAPEVTGKDSSTDTIKGVVPSGETGTIYTGATNNYLEFASIDASAEGAGQGTITKYEVSTSPDFTNATEVNSGSDFDFIATTAGTTYYVRAVDEVGNKSAATTVTVKKVTLEVTPTSVSVENEKTTTLTATGVNTGAITWESSDPTIATVSEEGVVTAHKVGTVTITARAENDSTVTATSEVTVTPGLVTIPTAEAGLVYNSESQTGVPESNDSKYTITGNTATNAGNYTATVSLVDPVNYKWADNTTANKQISWSIAPKTLTATAINAQDKVYDGTTTVTGGEISLDGVETADIGKVSATAGFAFENATAGNNKTVNVTNITLTGEKAGNYVLGNTTTTTTANITKAEREITVTTSTPVYVGKGTSQNIQFTYNGGEDQTLTISNISSSTSGVVTTTYTDGTKAGTIGVTGVDAGTTTLTIELPETTNYAGATKTVTVTTTDFEIAPVSSNVMVGDTVVIVPTISPSEITNITGATTINWVSSNTSKATVSSATTTKGGSITVTAVEDGTVTITATLNGQTKTATVDIASKYAEYEGNNTTPIRTYRTLADALANVTSGNTIKPLVNTTETTLATLASGKTVTLDLNGKTITTTANVGTITNNGTLTIKDSVGNGKIQNTNSTSSAKIINNAGTLTFGGTNNFYVTGESNNINQRIIDNSGTLNINKGTIQQKGALDSSLTSGYRNNIVSSGTLTISTATIETTNSSTTTRDRGISITNAGTCEIKTGANISFKGVAVGAGSSSTANTEASPAIKVTGGTITGANAILNAGTGLIYINGSGAQLTGSSYGIDNWGQGDIKVVAGNITGGTAYAIYNDAAIISDSETAPQGNIIITGGNISGAGGIYNAKSQGTVTISGGTITSTSASSYGVRNSNGGTTEITGGTINSAYRCVRNSESSTLTISGGTFNATGVSGSSYSTQALSIAGGTVNVSGGTFNVSKGTNTNSNLVELENNTTSQVTITGGTFTGDQGGFVVNGAGTVNISGTANITAVTTGVHNVRTGTVNITGGTITTTGGYGVRNAASGGTINIGTNDSTVISVDNETATEPRITGSTYGAQIAAGEINFYDGVIKGATNQSIVNASGTAILPTHMPTNYTTIKTNENEIQTAVLGHTYTVTANSNGGTIGATTGWTIASGSATATKTVTYGDVYGTLPTPTKAGNTFMGWNGKNLFNKDATPTAVGSYIRGDGTTGTSSEYSTYKINVKPNTTYTITNSGKSNAPGYVIYNSSDTRVGGANYANTKNITFTTPSNASYIIVSVVTDENSPNNRYDKDTFQIEENSTATEYEPYLITASTIVTTERNHTITAVWTSDVLYTVNHYGHDIGTNTYTVKATDRKTVRPGTTITLANEKRVISGFTYENGFANTGDTTKPTSGAVTTTTVAADGTTVINLYYRRNRLYVQYHMNEGTLASTHGSTVGTSGSLVTRTDNSTPTNWWRGVYGSKVGGINSSTYVVNTSGLENYNNSSAINIQRTGYKAQVEQEWCITADGTGTKYSQLVNTYNANDMAAAAGENLANGDVIVTLYVNWIAANYAEYNGSTLVKYYTTLNDAFTDVTNGNTIKPIFSATSKSEDAATLASGKTAILDLNGKTINMTAVLTNNGNLTINGTGKIAASASRTITNNGTLTAAGTVEINGTASTASTIANNGTLNVNGATVSSTNYKAIYNGESNAANAKVNILSGTVSAKNYAIENYGTATGTTAPSLKITGGTIQSTGAVSVVNRSTGTVYISGGTVTQGVANTTLYNDSTGIIQIAGGTIENTGTSYAIRNQSTGTINITSGSITATGSNAVYNYVTGTVNVSGGTISGTSGIYNVAAGIVNVTGGSITGTANQGIRGYTGTVTVSGDSTTITGAAHGIHVTTGTATVTGGRISGGYGLYTSSTGTITVGADNGTVTSVNNETSSEPRITGTTAGIKIASANGTFNFYDGYVKGPDGKSIVNGSDSATLPTNTPTGYVVQKTTSESIETALLVPSNYAEYNGSTLIREYLTLADAFANATSGNTIKPLKNTTETELATIAAGKTITLDTNGKTITYLAGGESYTDPSNQFTLGSCILNNGTLNITGNGTIKYEGPAVGNNVAMIITVGELNIRGGTINPGSIYTTIYSEVNTSDQNAYSVNSNITIGTNDSTVSTTSPVIIGFVYEYIYYNNEYVGVNDVNFYDGIVYSIGGNDSIGAVFNSSIYAIIEGTAYSKVPSGYALYAEEDTTYGYKVTLKQAYPVKYNANGGSGGPNDEIKYKGIAYTIPTTKPTRTGYTFAGWNTKADGTGTSYAAGATYTGNAALTLYAQWTANKVTIKINKDGSAWADSGMKVTLYNGTTSTGCTATISSGNSAQLSGIVPNGTYNVYVGKDSNHKTTMVDSKVDVTVNNNSPTATVNYYTLTVQTATGGTATVNGTSVANNGTVIVAGGTTTKANNYAHAIVGAAESGYSFSSWTAVSGSPTIASTTTASTTVKLGAASTIKVTGAANKVTVAINKDGSAWADSGMKVTLYNGTTSTSYTATISSGSSAQLSGNVPNGTYNVYIGKDSNHKTTLIDSGVDVTVNNNSPTATVNYYTLTVQTATGGTATVNGTSVANNGTVIVAGGTTTKANNYAHAIVGAAESGYSFSSWTAVSGSPTIASTTTASTTVKVGAASTIKVTGAANTYTITYDYNYLDGDIYESNSYLTRNFTSNHTTGTTSYADNASAKYGKEVRWTVTALDSNGGDGGPHMQPFQPSASLTAGKTYTWSVYVKASKAMKLNIGQEQGGKKVVDVTTGWQRITHTFTATDNQYHSFSFYWSSGTKWAVGDVLYMHSLELKEVSSLNTTTQTKTYGNTLGTLPTASRTGYTFAGWYTAPVGGTKIATTTAVPAADTTYYAHWTINTYTVTYNYATNGGTSATKTTDTKAYGTAIDLTPTATKSGWTFVGWNTSSTATTGLSSLNMGTSNVTLYAIYSKTLTGTFKYYNNQTVAANNAQKVTIYNTATSGNITTPAAAGTPSGYTFRGWSTSNTANASSPKAASTSVSISADTTFYASYQTSREATFYYNSNTTAGSITVSTAKASATRYMNYTGTYVESEITVPTAVTGSIGQYNTPYHGVATAVNSMTTATVNTANTTYYAIYGGGTTSGGTGAVNSKVTVYRPSSESAATTEQYYRNEFFTNVTSGSEAMSTVLSKSATGKSNQNPTLVDGYTFYRLRTATGASGGTAYTVANAAKTTVRNFYATETKDVTVTATFYYNSNATNGSTTISTATADGVATQTLYCSSTTAAATTKTAKTAATIPTAVTGSVGTYNNAYAGLSESTGNMTQAVAASATTVSINANKTYYAIYRTTVKEYYNNTNRNIYRNQWFTSTTAMSNPVLSTSTTGTTNLTPTTGPTVNGVTPAWAGYSTANNTTRTYTTVAAAAKTDKTTLYAVYSYTVTVTYNGNGNTGGTVPAAQSGTAYCNYTGATKTGASITLAGNVLSKTGHSQSGWNTVADGSGTNYNASTAYTFTENKTLYAKWNVNNYTVTYNANNFSTVNKTNSGLTVTYNQSTSILTINGTYTGTNSYNFNKLANQSYADGDKINITLTYQSGSYTTTAGNPTFIMDLQKNNANYSPRTNGTHHRDVVLPNSGTATGSLTIGSSTTDATGLNFWLYQNTASGTTFTDYQVKVNVTKETKATIAYGAKYSRFPANPTRVGSTFKGWYTAETGGTQVTSSTNMTTTSNHTIYAQWTTNKAVLHYYPNGGTAKEAYPLVESGTYAGSCQTTQTITYGATNANAYNIYNVTTLFTREGYVVAGDAYAWRKDSSSSTTYINQANQDFNQYLTDSSVDMKLYANWVRYQEVTSGGTHVAYYTTLQAAFTGVTSGNTIKPLLNITDEMPLATLDSGKTVTLNLNGKTVSMNNSYYNPSTRKCLITNNGILTINGSGELTCGATITIENNGTLTKSGTSTLSNILDGNSARVINNRGTATINDGTIISALNGIINEENATLTVSNTTITSELTGISNSGNATVSSGTISGQFGITNDTTGTLTINGGTIYTTLANGDRQALTNYGMATINSGTIYNNYGGDAISNSSRDYKGTLIVKGGTITGDSNGIKTLGGTVQALGGTITGVALAGISNDTVVDNSSTSIIIGATGTTGPTINGGDNAVYSNSNASSLIGKCTITINSGILNATRHGITAAGYTTVTMKAGTITAEHGIVLEAYSTNKPSVSISGGTITATQEGIYDYPGGTITISGGTISAGSTGIRQEYGSGTYTVTGGTITSSRDAAIRCFAETKLTIGKNDGTISTTSPVLTGKLFGVTKDSGATINFYDGKIVGKSGSGSALPDGYTALATNSQLNTTLSGSTETVTLVATRAAAQTLNMNMLSMNTVDKTESNLKELAEVDGVNYTTIASAIETAIASGKEVKLLEDIELEENITIPENSTVTLNLNGKTITTNEKACIVNNGNLTVKGKGKIVVSEYNSTGILNTEKAEKLVISNEVEIEILAEELTNEDKQKLEAIKNTKALENSKEYKEFMAERKQSTGICNNSKNTVELESASIRVERLNAVGIENKAEGTVILGKENSEYNSKQPTITATAEFTTAIVNSGKGKIEMYDGSFSTLTSVSKVITKVQAEYEISEQTSNGVIETILKMVEKNNVEETKSEESQVAQNEIVQGDAQEEDTKIEQEEQPKDIEQEEQPKETEQKEQPKETVQEEQPKEVEQEEQPKEVEQEEQPKETEQTSKEK